MLKCHPLTSILLEKHLRSRKYFQISKTKNQKHTKNYQWRKQTKAKAKYNYKGSIKEIGNCPHEYGKLCQFHERLKLLTQASILLILTEL